MTHPWEWPSINPDNLWAQEEQTSRREQILKMFEDWKINWIDLPSVTALQEEFNNSLEGLKQETKTELTALLTESLEKWYSIVNENDFSVLLKILKLVWYPHIDKIPTFEQFKEKYRIFSIALDWETIKIYDESSVLKEVVNEDWLHNSWSFFSDPWYNNNQIPRDFSFEWWEDREIWRVQREQPESTPLNNFFDIGLSWSWWRGALQRAEEAPVIEEQIDNDSWVVNLPFWWEEAPVLAEVPTSAESESSIPEITPLNPNLKPWVREHLTNMWIEVWEIPKEKMISVLEHFLNEPNLLKARSPHNSDAPENSAALIYCIQYVIDKLWIETWSIDWIYWNNTSKWVREFQKQNWLSPDWIPWKDTITKIVELLKTNGTTQTI